jgi:formate hydrogenlyase subunit 6/NADH:ubiquinone oxidoreductase subunit I
MAFLNMAKTTIFNLFKKPATLMYPFKPRVYYKNTKGKLVIDFEKCIFCMMCQKKCPTDAIIVDRTKKTWEIERLRCISCGSCVEVCPKKCLALENQYTESFLTKDKKHSIEAHQGA